MIMKREDLTTRSDRVLFTVLAIVLATASAAVGASLNTSADMNQIRIIKVDRPVVRIVQAPAIPASITVRASTSEVAQARLLEEHRCLSEAMYFEARGEGQDGQKAVAEVIFHRMNTGNYGHSICAVVYEGVGTATCQFSFACSVSHDAKKSPDQWRRAQALGARILTGEERLRNETGGAINFHATSIEPEWAGDLVRTVQIGNHIFYRRGHAHSTGA